MTILIIFTIIWTLTVILATVYGAYLFGMDKMKSKMLVDFKRREKRLQNSLGMWQNAYVKAKGGELKPKPPREPSESKPKRIVAASEVVSELKNTTILTEKVPKAIEQEFLEKTKEFV